MVALFAGCLFVLIFGLNLKVISRTLTLTAESPKDVVTQLTKMGAKIACAGFAIFVIGVIVLVGIAKCGLEPRAQDGIAITSMGAAVIALGFTTIVGAVGHGHEKAVRIGYQIALGVGAGVFLIGLIANSIMTYC